MTGKVKMFNKEKGYGFIHGEDNKDYFFHYSALIMEGFKIIAEGTNVTFEVESSEKGPRAASVKTAE